MPKVMLTDKEKVLVVRGMSLACGLLKAVGSEDYRMVRDYQDNLAKGWALRPDPDEMQKFMALCAEVQAAHDRGFKG